MQSNFPPWTVFFNSMFLNLFWVEPLFKVKHFHDLPPYISVRIKNNAM